MLKFKFVLINTTTFIDKTFWFFVCLRLNRDKLIPVRKNKCQQTNPQ